MTVIVAGQGRKAGKTATVCDIIAATTKALWTAIKITSHGHGFDLTAPLLTEATGPETHTDSGRYRHAGAVRAFWLRCKPEHISSAVMPLLSGNVIMESNSAVGLIPADLVVFVEGDTSSEWKPSAGIAASHADVRVHGRIDTQTLDRIRALVEPV